MNSNPVRVLVVDADPSGIGDLCPVVERIGALRARPYGMLVRTPLV